MSQRRRLPNSLRWRAVGWMEMGLSQADAARRLNVSRSVVQRLWDQYQSEDSVSEDRPTTSYNTCRRPFSSSFGTKEKTTTVPQLVADHFQASGKNLCYYGAKSSSQCIKSCVRSPQRTTAKEPLMLNMFLGRSNNGLLCCSQISDLQWR
ncbi:uncharacterized protein TNCV_1527611 [Trichonephila clavipes]|nr:uncharacterized protein TNCV_1527611 [Trichonephila clavipes]